MGITLQPFIEAVQKKNLHIEGIVLLQNGEKKAEKYFIPERRRNQHSVSKSFVSTAAGFAVAEGLFDIHDPVSKYFEKDFPQNPSENLRKLKIRDLLTMASGHDKRYLMSDERPGIRKLTDDWVSYCFAQPLVYAPGEKFVYNNACPYLIGVLIQRLTGMNLVEYLMPRLFAPLGIPRPEWEQDPRGYTFGGGGLMITVNELARFSQMYLQNGVWEGKQIVPREWVKEATRFQIQSNSRTNKADNILGYGYYFWRGQHDSFRSDGIYSQYGIVLRDKNAVIAINANEDRQQMVLDTVWETIYPTL